jgi:Tol biopolymer transport system component
LTATLPKPSFPSKSPGLGPTGFRWPSPISGDPTASRVITATVRADLERSGLFKLVDASGAALDENSPINHADWKGKGADALAAGSLGRSPDGRMEARFRLYDTQKGVIARWRPL